MARLSGLRMAMMLPCFQIVSIVFANIKVCNVGECLYAMWSKVDEV